ncbi:DitF protein [Sphingobium sp. SCG-1]|nr:DitF protein [Sphingobium sp. SCG-1]
MFRKPTVYPFELAVDACIAAIQDAGLTAADVDGIATWPGGEPGVGHGSTAASVVDVKNSLGLKLNWYSSGRGPSQFGAIANAIGAIAAGLCNHVLCFRAEGERWVPTYGRAFASGELPVASGYFEWMLPYWSPSAGNWTALHADLHMRRTGLTREQLGWIPVTQRRFAAMNEAAVYREPMTHDDYMSARMISTPLCIYDCDVPIDGAAAVVISRLDAARELPQKPVRFEAVGTAIYDHDSWFGRSDFPNMAMHDAAKMMWQRTDLKPSDIDTAHLYDGFSWMVVAWMEALGLTKPGETGAFIEGGQRIGLEGDLPLNTNGGQLSEGRLHAFSHLIEAVRQLRGTAGPRQVKDAEVSVCGAGGGVYGASFLLTCA